MDRQAVLDEMEQARRTFHQLLESASGADLQRPTNGTRWTNRELLFHMVFGYMIVLRLLVLVRVFGRLPDRASRIFAAVLESLTRPYNQVNYLGSRGGALVFNPERLGRQMDRVVARLTRHLVDEQESELSRGMHYPPSWDPFFKRYMTMADVYHFPTQHFDFHRRQLTLDVQD